MNGDRREIAAVERGAITFRWDLDKTYLRTEFESLRKMVRIPFEAGADKVHLPGVPQLIQQLRASAERRGQRAYVYFLSASPPQIGAAIEEKLALDGVAYDGIRFKDQLGHLVRGRWGSLTEQVGYKLGELLAARARGPASAREVLFGDDWESDPLIYSIYADVLAGEIDGEMLGRVLEAVGVARSSVVRIVERAEPLYGSALGVVEKIFINLERRTPPSRFRSYGPRLVPTFNTVQAAAALYGAGHIDLDGVLAVATAILGPEGGAGHRLRNSIDDLTRRGHLDLESRDRLVRGLARAGLAPLAREEEKLRARLRAALARFRREKPPAGPVRGADYEALLAAFGS